MATFTNQSKNSASFTNSSKNAMTATETNKGGVYEWDGSNVDWDDASVYWPGNLPIFNNQNKS